MDLLDMQGETERRILDRSSEREDMEEGELSDVDEVGDTGYNPQVPKPRISLAGVGRALPDLLNDIGVTEFNVLDEETTEKLGARAKRFNLDSHITYAEVSRMYETLGIPEKDRKPGISNNWRLETIHIRGTELMEEDDVLDYFKDYNPLEVCRVDNMSCNVAWGTAANSSKAMLGLSQPIASPHTRKVIHRIASSEEMEEERVVVEEDVDEVEGEKPVDPSDIEVAVPPGYWRIGKKHEKAEALFLRFAKVAEVGERLNFGEFDARNRSLTMGGGLLSRSKREILLAERDKQLEREQAEREREIDGKNPWGSIAESWGGGGRGREQAREYPIPLEHLDRPPRSFRIGLKDWDAPEDQFDPVRIRPPLEESGRRKRSIKDRLQMDKRVVDEESEEEAAETFISEGDDDSEIEWTKKRKKPRMGMVADMVEKKNVKDRIGGEQKHKKELIKRKIANKTSIEVFEEEEEEEIDEDWGKGAMRSDWEEEDEARRVDWRGREDLRLSVRLEDRPILSATKRLNERFRGGRLAGRLGDGIKVEEEEREVKNFGEREGRESRRQYSRNVESDGGDSLENDDGEDLKSDFGNAANMVIQVNQSDDETMDVDLKYEDARGREEKESGRSDAERERRERDKRRENEARERRKERERAREKEREREAKEREREKRKDLERERELERINREKKDQERELNRLKEKEREKRRERDLMEERTRRADKREREIARQRDRERERKGRDRDREREREKEREKRREREKERSKTASKSTSRKKRDESEDVSSDVSTDESSSDSESESDSSSNSESSSDSSSGSSGKSSSDSESEEERRKKRGKDTKESSQRVDKRKETGKDALKKDEGRERKDAKAKSKDDKKLEKNTEDKKASLKKEKGEENTDDKKKADELRNKLKNYLQAAQAAKEKKKDAEKEEK